MLLDHKIGNIGFPALISDREFILSWFWAWKLRRFSVRLTYSTRNITQKTYNFGKRALYKPI